MTALKESTFSDSIRKHNVDSSQEAKKLFKQNPHPSIVILMIQLFIIPTMQFILKYTQTFKKGTLGVIESFLFAFFHFLIISKYAVLAYNSKKS